MWNIDIFALNGLTIFKMKIRYNNLMGKRCEMDANNSIVKYIL